MKQILKKVLTILLFALTIALPIASDWVADSLRYYGWALQIIGTILILVSLHERVKLFGNQTLLDKIISFFFRRKKHVSMSAGTAGISVSGGRARLKVSPSKNIDGLIEHFNKEIDDIYTVIREEKLALTQDIRKLEERLSQRIQNVDSSVQEVRTLMTQSMTSNAGRELYGITCFLFGITYATVPDLILFAFK